MANAKAKLYYTKQKYLDTLPIENGNIIFVPDNLTMCLDLNTQRYTYKTIQVFATNDERIAYSTPSEGFYFVEETQTFWRWKNDTWRQVSPSNLTPVVHGETPEDFPQTGQNETLYYTDEGIYNWKNDINQYNLIANANRWDNI